MANTRNSNTWYVDTAYSSAANDFSVDNAIVMGIVLTPSAANSVLTLSDPTTGALKLTLKLSDTRSELFDLSTMPVAFPNGIRVTTLTNCVATLITRNTGS